MKNWIRTIILIYLCFSFILIQTACSDENITPNQILSSAFDAEIVIRSSTAKEEGYRMTLHFSNCNENKERKGEIIYLSPSALSEIRIISDESGKRMMMDDIESSVMENELFLPFTMFSTGEIIGKEISEEEIIYRYTDGRSIYFCVKEERITRITYRDVECTVEWIEIRQEKDA